MAVSASIISRTKASADVERVIADLAFDSSYPTGGEALPSTIAMRAVTGVAALGDLPGYSLSWDDEAQKLLVYYSDNNNAADGPQIQVPDTTDLSTALPNVRVEIIGN